MKRAIIIVLDAVGIGELPDAGNYGDTGSNTLINLKKECPDMELPNMVAMGIGNINGASLLGTVEKPTAAFGKMAEASQGKDTTTGHWEIAGVVTEKAFATYPNGFPQDIISKFESLTGTKAIGNYASSGTEILEVLGDEHVKTGNPIVYTSADSVFQIAAHESVIPLEKLYEMCEQARSFLDVARVIARPFTGESGNFKRTKNRKDFSLKPTAETILDYIKKAGKVSAAVGKIEDIFAGQGMTDCVHTSSNMDGIDKTIDYLKTKEEGLIFTNLVDTDMIYGHRNDVLGFKKCLEDFDSRLPEILQNLKDDDILFITADHGCDPTTPSTDHSREYVPLLVFGKKVIPTDLKILPSFADIGATILEYLNVAGQIKGTSFLTKII